MTDEQIWHLYMLGFNDELSQTKELKKFSSHEEIAVYEIGRQDAIIGDDVPSYDYRSKEETIAAIRAAVYKK